MTKAVFTTKIDPTYDDLPEERYHFPRTYLRQVEAAVGDFIVYYEPRRDSSDPSSRDGRQCYFAVARLSNISPDPMRPDHFYANVEQFLPFANPVPFREGGFYYEKGLQKADGSTNRGAFGRAVRNLSDEEYGVICAAGFDRLFDESQMTSALHDHPDRSTPLAPGFAEDLQSPFEPELEQGHRETQIVERSFRDRAFSLAIKSAYHDTCAVTGLKIINGGGRSEVQAAHIRPVADRGPDSVRNGLALSSTIHWMFDRGLLSVGDDYNLLTARNAVPDRVSRLINPSGRLLLPKHPEERPHPQFLHYHREHVFKG